MYIFKTNAFSRTKLMYSIAYFKAMVSMNLLSLTYDHGHPPHCDSGHLARGEKFIHKRAKNDAEDPH